MAAQASMAELFGSDSEDEGEERQPAAPAGEATGDAGGDDADAASDLFGSDDDDDGEEAPAVGPLPNSAAPVTFAIPSMPRPSADSKVSARCHAPTLANYRDTAHLVKCSRTHCCVVCGLRTMAQLFLVRLPNTNLLGIQSRPFDPETFEEEEQVEEEEDGGKTRVENVIRWRETRETGERQSNARVVTWSDGSMTLHVGSEVLVAQQVPIPEGTTHLFTRHQGSHLECHGVLKHKLTLAPASRDSKAHQALTHKIARVHTKGQKMQFHSTTEDPAAKHEARQRDYDDKKRLMARQASHRARADDYADAAPLTADFLDAADDDDLDGNLGALKAQFKNRKRGGPSGARSSGGSSRRRSGGGSRRRNDDEDDEDEDDEDEDDDEEEDEGDPAEMDGFIVGDEDEDEEDAESSDDERLAKTKKGKASKKRKKARLADEDSDE